MQSSWKQLSLLYVLSAVLSSASAASITVFAAGPHQVWGGNNLLPNIDVPFGGGTLTVPGYYNTPNSSLYTLLGQSSSTASYSGDYRYFVIGTLAMITVDSIAIDGGFLDYGNIVSTGNLHAPYQYDANGNLIGSPLDYPPRGFIFGPPDGRVDEVGLPPNSFALGGPLKGYLAITPIPEPSTAWLLLVGLAVAQPYFRCKRVRRIGAGAA